MKKSCFVSCAIGSLSQLRSFYRACHCRATKKNRETEDNKSLPTTETIYRVYRELPRCKCEWLL